MSLSPPGPAFVEPDFAIRVADGLREPARAIQEVMSLLMETELTREQRELAGTASGTAKVLLDTANDLFDLSQIETGQVMLAADAFDLRLIAEDAVDLGAARAEAQAIDLILRYSSRLPRRAIGDPGRVRQILVRLVCPSG